MNIAEAIDKVEDSRILIRDVRSSIDSGNRFTCDSCGHARYDNQTAWQFKNQVDSIHARLIKLRERLIEWEMEGEQNVTPDPSERDLNI